VLRREQRRFFSASDDEVGGSMRAMREQLKKEGDHERIDRFASG
jgi:hypothetical protein